MRPLSASLAFLRPVVLLTRVLPTLKCMSIEYQEWMDCVIVLSDVEG